MLFLCVLCVALYCPTDLLCDVNVTLAEINLTTLSVQI